MPGTLAIDGSDLLYTYTPGRDAVADGIRFSVQFSDTLAPGSWTPDQVDQGTIGAGGIPVAARVPMGSSNRRFVRLLISNAPNP
jgi:hypothetical protein